MSIWAEIKHALNSTLGTDEFKPLDKIINENNYVISSNSTLYKFEDTISENVAVYPGGLEIIKYFPTKIKMKTFGYFSFRFFYSITVPHNITAKSLIVVYKNGIEFHTFEIWSPMSTTKEENLSETFYFDTDDKFSFELRITINYLASTTSARYVNYSLSDLGIYGTVQTSTFKPIPIETTEV